MPTTRVSSIHDRHARHHDANGRVIGCAMGRSTRTSAKRRDADGHGFANGATRVSFIDPQRMMAARARGGFAEGNRANPLGRREGLATSR
jgi:hypothetical protein